MTVVRTTWFEKEKKKKKHYSESKRLVNSVFSNVCTGRARDTDGTQ